MRSGILSTLVGTAILGTAFGVGCSQQQKIVRSQPAAPKPILLDEYTVLDDQRNGAPLSDEKLRQRLEQARVAYLKALRSVEQKDQATGVQYFEAAIAILNELTAHPDIESVPEFTKLSQSVVRDYEDKITSTDYLDPNSNFFVLRDKMFQEIELLPVAWKSPEPAEAGPSRPDTLVIALPDNEAVQQTLAYFTSEKGRRFFSKWLARTGRFFPMYERILAEEGAPDEIKYLSMIESGLNPTIISPAGALGLWQFMKPTGKAYGLDVDSYRDERRDPEKATRAAARYLLDLYEDMGDWHLALGSYNCGPGRMRRALGKADTHCYWEARKNLPRETRQYVPLYIAAAKIAMNPEAYGFTDIVYEQPDQYEVVKVDGTYDFATLAFAGGFSYTDLTLLNPELLQDRTPPVTGYELKVPIGYSERLAMALDTLSTATTSALSQNTVIEHKVKKGETLTGIASQYGVDLDAVLAANDMTSKSTLLRGSTLKIPSAAPGAVAPGGSGSGSEIVASAKLPERARTASAEAAEDAVAVPSGRSEAEIDQIRSEVIAGTDNPAIYVVVEGETLADVARKHRVGIEELASWNNLSAEEGLSIGQKLLLRPDAVETPSTGEDVLALVDVAPTAERKADQEPLSLEEDFTNEAPSAPVNKVSTREAKSVKVSKAETVSTTKKSAKKGSYVTHTVRRGETLTGIAGRYGVSMAEIKEANPKGVNSDNEVLLGAKLRIYTKDASGEKIAANGASSTKKAKATKAKDTTPSKYRVVRGDTLSTIADKLGVSMSDLRAKNPRLDPNNIRAGQVLRVQ